MLAAKLRTAALSFDSSQLRELLPYPLILGGPLLRVEIKRFLGSSRLRHLDLVVERGLGRRDVARKRYRAELRVHQPCKISWSQALILGVLAGQEALGARAENTLERTLPWGRWGIPRNPLERVIVLDGR